MNRCSRLKRRRAHVQDQEHTEEEHETRADRHGMGRSRRGHVVARRSPPARPTPTRQRAPRGAPGRPPPGRRGVARGVVEDLAGGPRHARHGVAQRRGRPLQDLTPGAEAEAPRRGRKASATQLRNLTPEQRQRLQDRLQRAAANYAALTADQKQVLLGRMADSIERLRDLTPEQQPAPDRSLPEAARPLRTRLERAP